MKSRNSRSPDLAGFTWLSEVRHVVTPVSPQHPVWVQSMAIRSGPASLPESHSNCELCFIEEGAGIGLVGREKMEHSSGDLLLYGSGVPHWFRITRYPFRFTAVYFLPNVLFELAPEAEAARMLRRFTARQNIEARRIRPPLKWRDWCQSRFHELNEEFTARSFGWEAKLRILLLEVILDLMRWEQANGRPIPHERLEVDWTPIERAFRYLREHVSEPIYGRDLAAAAGVGESRLKVLFREIVGATWSHFLQGYRIHLAAARLCEPGRNIMEVANSVGFENQSHFSATFHSLMGVSPRQYARRVVRRREEQEPAH